MALVLRSIACGTTSKRGAKDGLSLAFLTSENFPVFLRPFVKIRSCQNRVFIFGFFFEKKNSVVRLTTLVRATVHHVRPATYAHTTLDLHTRIVARVQHVAQRHCHLLSYLSHHRNQSPHPSSSAIIRNHRHPVPHRRFRRCTPRPALHTQRASNAHAQAAPLSASAAATAQRRTRSQSHDHHHHVPQAALRPKR